jgi:hypothetical protein
MNFKIINKFDKDRIKVETFIKEKYWNIFKATIQSYPAILVAIFDEKSVLAACGLRTELDGFFSEIYLSTDIYSTTSKLFNHNTNPKIIEISNLVSNNPIASLKMTKEINKFCLDRSIDYVFFTATKLLQKFLNLTGLDLIKIGTADINKIKCVSLWGSYYENNPNVYLARVPELSSSILFRNIRKNLSNVEFINFSNQAL